VEKMKIAKKKLAEKPARKLPLGRSIRGVMTLRI
jgi:hypothetical protein